MLRTVILQCYVGRCVLYRYLELSNELAQPGDEIYIPQHPMAHAKQIAMKDSEYGDDARCQVKSNDNRSCTGGSSFHDIQASPIFLHFY